MREVGVGQKYLKYWEGVGCEVEIGVGVGGSKVSQILGITNTIASWDTYAGCVKSVQMVSLRRWLNGDGWGGG